MAWHTADAAQGARDVDPVLAPPLEHHGHGTATQGQHLKRRYSDLKAKGNPAEPWVKARPRGWLAERVGWPQVIGFSMLIVGAYLRFRKPTHRDTVVAVARKLPSLEQ